MEHPFAELLGFVVDQRTGGTSQLSLEIDRRHLNPHGLVHGAVPYALADTGMGAALTSVLGDGELCTTIEIKINYFRPWREGRLRCDTRVVHRGRTTAALLSDLFDGAGRHLAQATGTFAIIERPAVTSGSNGGSPEAG